MSTREDALFSIFDEAVNLDDNTLSANSFPILSQLQSNTQRYTNFTLISQGGLKKVYKCFDTSTKNHIAYAQPSDKENKKHHEMFAFEAQLTARLQHPNIIKVFELGYDDSFTPYFSMELKRNTTLKDYISQKKPLQELLDIFFKVCNAIEYSHSQGVLHLDLKPENIQCDKYGEVLVCDWGLARYENDSSPELFEDDLAPIGPKTLYGAIKGTPGYMAPEQIKPGGTKTQKTDIFSLGAILYLSLIHI